MHSIDRSAASARLDVARREQVTATDDLNEARGAAARFHASVQLRAAEDEVEARAAWLAWADRGDADR